MTLKAVFILCACVALALGAAIEPRDKRETDASSNTSGLSSFTNSFTSGSQTGSNFASQIPGADIASSAATAFTNGIQDIGGRIQSALNQTYQEERNSVSDGFNSVKDQIKQNVETGGNLTKTAFDLGMVFPKFGKNLIIGSSN